MQDNTFVREWVATVENELVQPGVQRIAQVKLKVNPRDCHNPDSVNPMCRCGLVREGYERER